jgi:addiction module RelE/StbE family toxin
MKVVFSTQAKANLREIALFIAEDNKKRATSFVRELRAKAVQIGNMPRAFPLMPRFETHAIRRRPFGSYLIFYRIEDDHIFIIDILHAAQDAETQLFQDS